MMENLCVLAKKDINFNLSFHLNHFINKLLLIICWLSLVIMFKFSHTLIILLCDIIALSLTFWVAVYVLPEIALEMGLPRWEISAPEFYAWRTSYGILSLLVVVSFFHKGHYTSRIPWWHQVSRIVAVMGMAWVVDSLMNFRMISPFHTLIAWFIGMVCLLLGRKVARSLLVMQGSWHRECVLLGDSESLIDTLYALHSDEYCGYRPVALLLHNNGAGGLDRSELPAAYQDIEIIEAQSSYPDYLSQHPQYFVMLALETFRGEERDKLMDTLKEHKLEYALLPPTRRNSLYGMEALYFFGYDVMFLMRLRTIRTPFGRTIKRLMDILLASLGLVMASPIALLLWLLIRRDGGSAFYGAPRVGREGELFRCWKFRSMHMDADERLQEVLANNPKMAKEYERYCKITDDPRVTRVGKFIRATSLDEIPQLFNVLVGDMSLVGPRPMLEKEIEKYGRDFYLYKMVRPGVTGLWQVSGRSDASFDRRARFDSWYIRHWSLWHDVVIILRTIKVVLLRSGAH